MAELEEFTGLIMNQSARQSQVSHTISLSIHSGQQAHLAHVLLRHLHMRLLVRLALVAVHHLGDDLRRADRYLVTLPPVRDTMQGQPRSVLHREYAPLCSGYTGGDGLCGQTVE